MHRLLRGWWARGAFKRFSGSRAGGLAGGRAVGSGQRAARRRYLGVAVQEEVEVRNIGCTGG